MDLAETDSDELLRRASLGDEDAFAALYRRFQGPVHRFAWRMTGRRETAEDVTQETFLALLRGPTRYEKGRGPLGAYLYGIARNLLARRLGRDRPYVPLSEGEEGALRATDLGADQERQRAVGSVREAVLGLPVHYREVVVLCELQGLPYEETAAALGCPVGTVRSRLHRARALLAARLRTDRAPAWSGSKRAVETTS
ncbi:MAG: RNA polymerase sigma factor [Vicinamibacteria bacterium]